MYLYYKSLKVPADSTHENMVTTYTVKTPVAGILGMDALLKMVLSQYSTTVAINHAPVHNSLVTYVATSLITPGANAGPKGFTNWSNFLQVLFVNLPPLRCRARPIYRQRLGSPKDVPSLSKIEAFGTSHLEICDDFRRGVCRRQSCRFRHIPHEISLPMTRPSKPNVSIQSSP